MKDLSEPDQSRYPVRKMRSQETLRVSILVVHLLRTNRPPYFTLNLSPVFSERNFPRTAPTNKVTQTMRKDEGEYHLEKKGYPSSKDHQVHLG